MAISENGTARSLAERPHDPVEVAPLDPQFWAPTVEAATQSAPAPSSLVTAPAYRALYAVERAYNQIFLARQPALPRPGRGQVHLQVLAASVCGSDPKVLRGDKTPNDPLAGAARHITLGHEGVGRVNEVGPGVEGLSPGKLVAIKPHYYSDDHDATCRSTARDRGPSCIGWHCSMHAGWDEHGCFADEILLPAANLAVVPDATLAQVAQALSDVGSELPPATLFSLTEPFACALSTFRLLRQAADDLDHAFKLGGRALVLGAGPMGACCALALFDQGYEVFLYDPLAARVDLACRWAFEGKVRPWTPTDGTAGDFDLVLSTAPTAEAFKNGLDAVRDRGVLYLFAGLGADDRDARDPDGMIVLEQVHRRALALKKRFGVKRLLLAGHSGYFDDAFEDAMALIGRHATTTDRLITAVVRGLASPRVASRLPGGSDVVNDDGTPALLSVLRGDDIARDPTVLARRLKLLILTEAGLAAQGSQS